MTESLSYNAYTATSSKRPRTATPQPIKRDSVDLVTSHTNEPTLSNDIRHQENVRVRNLRSDDRNVCFMELNELLQISANHDTNYSMKSDSILLSLCDIVIHDCLQWNAPIIPGRGVQTEKQFVIFRSVDAWTAPPTNEMKKWAEFCSQADLKKEEWKMCENIAMILRNFSFTGANIRLLAYSQSVLHVLVAFLYIGMSRNRQASSVLDPTIPLAALQVLRHLVSCLDVTGQQLLTDKLFYDGRTMGGGDGPAVPHAEEYGKCLSNEWGGFGACWLAKRLDVKEDTIENIPTQFLLDLTGDYLVAVWSIFPVIKEVLVDVRTPRSVILATLDFFQELINVARVGLVGMVPEEDSQVQPGQDYKIPSLRSILVNVPDSILDRLISLLYIPRSGPDSLDYIETLDQTVLRTNSLKLSVGYNSIVDFDCRDRALDVLVPLLELDSPRMAARVGRKSMQQGIASSGSIRVELYDSLIPILTTNVGRSDSSMLAVQLLRELAKAFDDNKAGFLYVKGRLIEIASRDARVSQLVWTDLYPIAFDDDEEEDINDADEANGR